MFNVSPKLFTTAEGYPVDYVTIASGDTTQLTKEFLEEYNSTDEKTLFMSCADDDSQTPTIKVEAALTFDNGKTWTDWFEIEAAAATPKEVQVFTYGKSWWVKNRGIKFRAVKAGTGAVSITKARWV